MKLQLTILENLYEIHRFPPNHETPNQVYESEFYSIISSSINATKSAGQIRSMKVNSIPSANQTKNYL